MRHSACAAARFLRRTGRNRSPCWPPRTGGLFQAIAARLARSVPGTADPEVTSGPEPFGSGSFFGGLPATAVSPNASAGRPAWPGSGSPDRICGFEQRSRPTCRDCRTAGGTPSTHLGPLEDMHATAARSNRSMGGERGRAITKRARTKGAPYQSLSYSTSSRVVCCHTEPSRDLENAHCRRRIMELIDMVVS